MKNIIVKVVAGAAVSGNESDSSRVTFIPSGYKGQWIMVVEDVDYSLHAEYLTPEEIIKFDLNSIQQRKEG
jgi:hypothetical protein